ncbi:release factor glutamine methyltransferase [bacterium A37T11]|nr:release factor glutamine methyltransferase [bacterium A37T11]
MFANILMQMNQSIRHFESLYTEQLKDNYDPAEARSLVRHILSDLMGNDESDYLSKKDKPLTDYIIHRLNEVLTELKKGIPVQYILGNAWFMGHLFQVNKAVLIPRPETEELTDQIIQDYRANAQDLHILDIGTGSGCIAIALQKQLPGSVVYALDISTTALEVARQNAQNLSAAVQFLQADILDPNSLPSTMPLFDVIVSNPPYITPSEQLGMEAHVKEQEPSLALFVPENDPLLFYRQIAHYSRQQLKPGGRIYVEINRRFGQETASLFRSMGFSEVSVYTDMQGAERIVKGINT